jgi:hypothetical protein
MRNRVAIRIGKKQNPNEGFELNFSNSLLAKLPPGARIDTGHLGGNFPGDSVFSPNIAKDRLYSISIRAYSSLYNRVSIWFVPVIHLVTPIEADKTEIILAIEWVTNLQKWPEDSSPQRDTNDELAST